MVAMRDAAARLGKLSAVPSKAADFDQWLRMTDAISFLRANAEEVDLVIYASTTHTFINAVVVPAEALGTSNPDDLMEWSCNPANSWSISVTLSDPQSASISPPLADADNETLSRGEQLVFSRHFDDIQTLAPRAKSWALSLRFVLITLNPRFSHSRTLEAIS